MADKQISDLPLAGSLADTDQLPADTALAVTQKFTLAQLKTFLGINGGSITSWQTITAASINAVSGNGIIANRVATPVQVVLPATFAEGDIIAILGLGTGGWSIVANSGQAIQFGSAVSSVAGSINSDIQYANIYLRGLVANTIWTVELVNSNPVVI